MPELPEVEVTRRRIKKLLVGRKIARIVTTKPSYFFLTSPRRLQQELSGQTVARLDRHGKYLLARLDSGSTLLLHLGRTLSSHIYRLGTHLKSGLLQPDSSSGRLSRTASSLLSWRPSTPQYQAQRHDH